MIISALIRLKNLFLLSIIASIPYILTILDVPLSVSITLLLSLGIFIVVFCFDCYNFAIVYHEKQDFFLGLCIPYFIYMLCSLLTYKLFSAPIFTCIFLPLRFFEWIAMKTKYSAAVMHFIFFVLGNIAYFLGCKRGKFLDELNEAENEALESMKILEIDENKQDNEQILN